MDLKAGACESGQRIVSENSFLVLPRWETFTMRGLLLAFAGMLATSVISCPAPQAAELAMGFRVGEVTQGSAIVWTRVTQQAHARREGYRDADKREPRQDEFVPPKVKVEDREGAVPGAAGQVRVIYSNQRGPLAAAGHTLADC
jgi:hypothetical protein